MIDPARPARKNLVLLAAMVVMLVGQPLLGHRSVGAGAFFDGVFSAICLYVFFVVFEQRWQRRIAFVLVLPAIMGTGAHYLLPPSAHLWSAVAFHCSVIVFLGFAVAVILGDIFRKRVIYGDDVIGALCGYLLGALVWANLYTLAYLIYPEAFTVNPEIAWRLGRWHLRRALFDYLSFTTLTGLGYSDISPGGPPVYSLTWMEVIFGQFYMAVVVAQLVGLKLAQAMKGDGPEST
jgi:voltage-gated potassium channel